MKTLVKMLFIFLAITGAYTLLYNYTDVVFGDADFFSKHGWLFLFSIALFPRLTMFVSGFFFNSIEFGGLIWWLGFFFAPRILVALLATLSYWHSNKLLVIFSWLIALGGESSEKFIISRRMKNAPQRFRNYEGGSTIDAEFKIKE
jgi:hypothetical protein